jgi:hypothetical protein
MHHSDINIEEQSNSPCEMTLRGIRSCCSIQKPRHPNDWCLACRARLLVQGIKSAEEERIKQTAELPYPKHGAELNPITIAKPGGSLEIDMERAIREDRDRYLAAFERLVPQHVRDADGTVGGMESWLKASLEANTAHDWVYSFLRGSEGDLDLIAESLGRFIRNYATERANTTASALRQLARVVDEQLSVLGKAASTLQHTFDRLGGPSQASLEEAVKQVSAARSALAAATQEVRRAHHAH